MGVLWYEQAKRYTLKKSDYFVTVGNNGDYSTLTEALEHLSQFKQVYTKNSYKIEARILSGTVITEQILIEREDLSYIRITSEDEEVEVDSSGWSTTLDSRGSAPLFGAQYGGRLPCIATVFKWMSGTQAVGYFCNRGSYGVIEEDCGFDSFHDNIIANNNSEVVIRFGVAKNADRWGIHARHISRISARSCDLTNCDIGAYADRASMIDVRESDLSDCNNAIDFQHGSSGTANGATANGIKSENNAIKVFFGSSLNASHIKIDNPAGLVFHCRYGSNIAVFGEEITNVPEGADIFNLSTNSLSRDGIIYN